eukprot:scaffold49572_cov66-Phaeocystis_antarctica.AAC.2
MDGTKGNGLPSHTYSEFANGTPRCMAAEHASKRFSSAGSPSTCAAWMLNAVESATSAGPRSHTAASHWALSGLRARPECVA